tara:strand:+ start:206 stop:535 length:330 start_codon:yes stop_codon:yes gene_type:complete
MKKLSLKSTQEKMKELRLKYHMNPNDDETFDQLIGARLRFARLVRNKTQSEVANAINVSFQQVQKYEWGTNEMKCKKMWKVSKYLGFSLKWMFSAFKHKEDKNNVNSIN